MALLLYLATATLVVLLVRRFVVTLGWVVGLLLVLLPCVFTGRALLTNGLYGPFDMPYEVEPLYWLRSANDVPGGGYNSTLSDVYTQMIPYRHAVQDALQNREWPIWNRFTLSGDILAGAAQAAPYSPFTLLACLLPVPVSFTYTATIWFFLAGIGALLLACELGCTQNAGLVAALAWMYSSGLAFFVLWPLGESWALLPLVLFAARRTVSRPAFSSGLLLLAVLTLLLVAGHPETSLHVVTLGVAYGCVRLAGAADRLRALIACLAAGAVALLLSAIAVLPMLDAAPQSRDYAFRDVATAATPVTPAESVIRLLSDLLPSLNTRAWRWNGVTHLPPNSAAVGSIALALSLVALVRRRGRDTAFLFGMLVFCLLAHSGWRPLASLLSRLPGFSISINDRFSFGAACAFAILAAIGVDEVFQCATRAGILSVLFSLLVLIALVGIGVEHAGLAWPNMRNWGDYRFAADLVGLAALTLLVMARLSPGTGIACVIALLLVQRVAQEGGVYPTFPASVAYPKVPLFGAMRPTSEPYRIAAQGITFVPGTSALYGLEDVRGYSALTLGRYVMTYPLWCTAQPIWFNRVDDLSRPFLSFLNVRYAVASRFYAVPDGWRVASRFRGSVLLENTRALPRAFVPDRVRFTRTPSDALAEMTTAGDFLRRAWIETSSPTPESENGPGVVASQRVPSGFRMQAQMAQDGWVIISEPAWRGWRAYVDGHRTEPRIANVGFLAVFVPKGMHAMRLVYRPESFVRGRATSALSMMGLLVVMFFCRRRLS